MEDVLGLRTNVYSPILSLDLTTDISRFVVRLPVPLIHSTHPTTDPEMMPSDAPIAEAAARAGFDCSNWYVLPATLPQAILHTSQGCHVVQSIASTCTCRMSADSENLIGRSSKVSSTLSGMPICRFLILIAGRDLLLSNLMSTPIDGERST